MDPKTTNLTDTPQPAPAAASVQQPTVAASAPVDGINLNPAKPIVPSSSDKKGSKMLWIIVLAIALIGVVGGGGYYMTQMNQSKPTAVTQPQVASTEEFDELQQEVSGVNVESFDAEFTDVDADLKGL